LQSHIFKKSRLGGRKSIENTTHFQKSFDQVKEAIEEKDIKESMEMK
jgi:hypothetical protein